MEGSTVQLDCSSVCRLLELNDQVLNIHQGAPALRDANREFSEYATLALSDIDPQELDDSGGLALVSRYRAVRGQCSALSSRKRTTIDRCAPCPIATVITSVWE